jgi:diguanylate cyclase (GGDEF)-like protein
MDSAGLHGLASEQEGILLATEGFPWSRPAQSQASAMLAALVKMTKPMIYHRIAAGDCWEYTFAGTRVLDVFGSPQEEVYGRQGFDFSFIHQDDRLRVARSYREVACGPGGVWESDFRIISRTGITKWLHAFADIETNEKQERQSVVILVEGAPASRAPVEAAAESDRDALTGLYNRSHFERAVTNAVELNDRIDCPFAIVIFDVDDFHEINVAHGFKVGDGLLRAIGDATAALANGATVSRLEGDRFAVLLDEVRADATMTFAADLHGRFKRPFDIEKSLLWVSVSTGITFSSNLRRDSIALVHETESALRRARESGGGISHVFSPDLTDDVLSRVVLKESLYEATAQEQFELHYQPKIELSSGHVVGAEALIRWRHPELGMQSPARFIPIAERTGLIVPIGEWAFRRACRQYVEWRTAGSAVVPIAVNVSALQFERSDVCAMISRALADFELPGHALEIEITEGMLVDCSDELIAELQNIRDIGVGIALDDFGTGFSSLAYLQRLPVSILKVDQAFVRGAMKNRRDAVIVRSIVELAEKLGMRTVAEGIETREDLAFVREASCQEGQGYLFSPPLLAADFAWFLKRSNSTTHDAAVEEKRKP